MPIGLNIAKWGASGIKPLILNVQTDNAGTSNNDQFTIALKTAETYNFTAKYDGQETSHATTTDLVLTFPSGAGNYDVEIHPQEDGTGFPAIQYNNGADDTKVLEIKQWGSIKFESMSLAFRGCSNMTITATDNPDTSLCDDFTSAFRDCELITEGIDCDMTAASSTSNMYNGTDALVSVPITDTSTITNMSYMFQNSGISVFPELDYSNVANPTGLFSSCPNLPDGPALDFSSATTLSTVFNACPNFTGCGTITTSTALTSVNSLFGSSGIVDAPSITVTSNVTNWAYMFTSSYVETCPTYDTSGGGTMFGMFQSIKSNTLDVPAFDFSAVTNLQSFVAGVIPNGAKSTPAINAPLCTTANNFADNNRALETVGTLTLTGLTSTTQTLFSTCRNVRGAVNVTVSSNVTSMNRCFSFLGFDSGSTSQITLNGTSGVTNFGDCFQYGSIDSVNLIDTSAATNCSQMFRDVTELDGFAMPTFDLGAMTSGVNMFSGYAMTTASWEALLVATEAANSNSSVTWSGGNATYNDPSSAATARAALIADHSWTITDGGSV